MIVPSGRVLNNRDSLAKSQLQVEDVITAIVARPTVVYSSFTAFAAVKDDGS